MGQLQPLTAQPACAACAAPGMFSRSVAAAGGPADGCGAAAMWARQASAKVSSSLW